MAGAQLRLLHIEAVFAVRAFRAMHYKAWTKCRRQHGRAQKRTAIARIEEREVEGIINDRTVPFDANVGANRFRETKKQERVIDQMRCEIEKNSATSA